MRPAPGPGSRRHYQRAHYFYPRVYLELGRVKEMKPTGKVLQFTCLAP